ncbi:MAG: transposase [Candidatus Omnitrophota bacterium]|nr:transposase [Candidatus Omnitrophota bacterium]
MGEKFQNKYRVRSARLKQWDYASVGGYFVTVCVKDRQCVFGNVIGGKMRLNELGKTADQCWQDIPKHFPYVGVDEYVVMPNHMHGIIIIRDVKSMKSVETQHCCVSTNTNTNIQLSKTFYHLKSGSLSVIMRSYKSIVAKTIHRTGLKTFAWQPRFYDHVIRNDVDLNRIRQYVETNPSQWADDTENPTKG